MATTSPPVMSEKVFDEKTEKLSGDVESTPGSSDDGDFVAPTPEEWRKLLWKLDLRIIPYVGVLYLCSFLDRVNIGNVSTYVKRDKIDNFISS